MGNIGKLTISHMLFSFVMALFAFTHHYAIQSEYLHSAFNEMLLFFFVQGLLINLAIDWARGNYPEKLSLFLLASVGFRLLTTIFACIFVLLIGVELKELFVINFLALYFIYLIFEMMSLVANLRRNSNRQ